MGAPGVGKGTQARMLAQSHQVPQISTGDILRAAVRDGTPLGRRAREYMDAGRLVPDEVVVGIVEERLKEGDCRRGYILDGFPRTIPQAQALKGVARLDRVVLIDLPVEELVRRSVGRRTCSTCGQIYHVEFDPPGEEGVCDKCGGSLILRRDDKEETVRARLKVYSEETEPLVDYYQKEGLLKRLDGVGSIDEIFGRLHGLLEGLS